MDKNNAKDFLPLVQALAEGKTLQYRPDPGDKWEDILTAIFSHDPSCYRIKPEPAALWVIYDNRDRLRATFESREEAAKYSGYVSGWRVVKFVESQN